MGKKGGSSAPSADPRMGEAALLSAQTGQQYLDFMKGQAATANEWAGADRARYLQTFRPLENELIQDARNFDSPERKRAAANEATADVTLAGSMADAQQRREAMAMGVNPASGAFQSAGRKAQLQTTLAATGAGNMARRRVEATADAKMADVVNLGKGMAVNPGTSLGLANGAASSGFSGAMQGYGQQASIYGQQHAQKMQAWEANQQSQAGLFGAIGNIAGMLPFFPSDETIKTDKKPVGRSLLKAVENMPVEEWTYKPGEGDGGRHVGTYAQDFQRETGKGDGRSINVVDAIGTTMGAVKELSAKVDKLAGAKPRAKARSLAA